LDTLHHAILLLYFSVLQHRERGNTTEMSVNSTVLLR